MTEPLVLVQPQPGGVVVLRLNRPPLNPLSEALLAEFTAEARALADDAAVKTVVIAGSDRAFAAGADIEEFGTAEDAREVSHNFRSACAALGAIPRPVIAAISGFALGGGLELALACDLRIAADGIRLGMPPAKLGLVYSHTGLRRFIDIVGVARTRELFLLGRNVEARRALDWGLVNEVVIGSDLEETALEWATELAANAPLSVQGNKRVIRELLRARAELDPDVERELIALREACFASEDMKEGVRAFGEKRPARWRGR